MAKDQKYITSQKAADIYGEHFCGKAPTTESAANPHQETQQDYQGRDNPEGTCPRED